MMKQILYIQKFQNPNNENLSIPYTTLQPQQTNNTNTLHETTHQETHLKQIIPFFTPSFFKYTSYFANYFKHADTHLTLPLIGYKQTGRSCFKTSL